MKINFIIPFIGLTGGIKAVFEWANGLVELGHTVNVIYPIIPYYFGKNFFKTSELIDWSCMLKDNLFNSRPKWYNKEIKFNLRKVFLFNSIAVPNADITIATAWPTAYSVNKLNSKKGKKMYCVFHYEKEDGNINKIDASYNFDMPMFTISSNSVKAIKNRFNKNIEWIIPCGVDRKEFFVDNSSKNWHNVLLYFDPNVRKGGDDGIKALKLILKRFKDLNITIFYAGIKPILYGKNIQFIERPISVSSLRKLYNRSGIFIYPSRREGFGMPPLEAMACKCAVITTNVGAVRDFATNNYSALIVEPNNYNEIADATTKLLLNNDLCKKLSENAYVMAQKFDWQKSILKLEKMLYEKYKS